MKFVYSIALGLGLTIAFFLYFVFFDNFSETELVTLSFLWIFMIGFGAMGLIFRWGYKKNYRAPEDEPAAEGEELEHRASSGSVMVALIIGGVVIGGLMLFFMIFWDSL